MMNLYYHHLHNIAKGIAFEGDHELMLGFYEAMDDAYDSLIERHIGSGGSMSKSDFLKIIDNAEEVLEEMPESEDFQAQLQHAQDLESNFRQLLSTANSSASLGTQNLLQDLCDQSEVRSYKLGQRLK
jgi:DNA-binding ferritin-like protein